jgi:hypothetical protein
MDANAWSLVEEDENAAETAEEDQRVQKALIAAIEEAEKRKCSSAPGASRSASSLMGGRGSEVFLLFGIF